ncbi:hypothetical protein CPB83DRAFT_863372 [Crepidotus variabilis]|uniref:DUF6534 domain-containing protein n=1 Tax=Crepidotus variabilis TaxID=179855 RepID=A0A9P6E608_9AGAR|nr:hypothetical protein CPB83DRAFT_863372 [Crepidotus variabilis]
MMLIGDPLIMSVLSTSTRLFVTWRMKCISSSVLIPAILGFVTATALAGGISFAANLASASNPDRIAPQVTNALKVVWLSATALADLIVAVTLSLSLRTRQPGAKIIKDRFAKFLRHSVHTGLVAAAISSSNLIVALALPHTTINFVWDVVLSKVYVISLLSILNTRTTAHNGTVTEENVLFGNHDGGSMTSSPSRKRPAEVYELGRLENSIAITTVVEQMKDPSLWNQQ